MSFPEILNWRVWSFSLRCVHANEPHAFARLKDKRVAIDHTLNPHQVLSACVERGDGDEQKYSAKAAGAHQRNTLTATRTISRKPTANQRTSSIRRIEATRISLA